MKELGKVILVGLLPLLGLASCSDGLSVKEYFINGNKCDCQSDDRGKKGECKCYYQSGKLKEISYWRNDSTKVNEMRVFYESGVLKEYHFINPAGKIRYSRYYDNQGKLLDEKGDFISHEIVSSSSLKVGDSLIIQIFIASPPDCENKVFGVDSEGRYELFKKTNQRFMWEFRNIVKEKGGFVLPYEVEFIDKKNDIHETRDAEISLIIED